MRLLTEDKQQKFNRILTKRLGRDLTNKELLGAYNSLMDFSIALCSLNVSETEPKKKLTIVKCVKKNV